MSVWPEEQELPSAVQESAQREVAAVGHGRKRTGVAKIHRDPELSLSTNTTT